MPARHVCGAIESATASMLTGHCSTSIRRYAILSAVNGKVLIQLPAGSSSLTMRSLSNSTQISVSPCPLRLRRRKDPRQERLYT
jgi:shikimate kinase